MNSTQVVGERAREAMLAGAPVSELRLPPAGVSTADTLGLTPFEPAPGQVAAS